jgi:tRNA nucleotidyltransferase (CCA-adding enzyme)
LDAWRKPARLQQFIHACSADFKGRTGFETLTYAQGDMLYQAYQVASGVDVKPIVEAGFRGAKIQEELNRQRIAAIDKLGIRQKKQQLGTLV